MKTFPKSALCQILLLLLVEQLVFTLARPAPSTRRSDRLSRLYEQMRSLLRQSQGALTPDEMGQDFQHNLTSLPTLGYTPQDFATLEVNSTLTQLSSGLHAFKLHFDWLIHWQNQLGSVSPKTTQITKHIQAVISLVEEQMKDPPKHTTFSLPTPTNWDVYRTFVVVHQSLFRFCDWSIRALRVLKGRRRH